MSRIDRVMAAKTSHRDASGLRHCRVNRCRWKDDANMMEPAEERSRSITPAPVDFDSLPTAMLLDLVRTAQATTRPELVSTSGAGRKAVTERVAHLVETGLLVDTGLIPSEGGRPVRTLALNPQAGHVVAAIVGSTEITLARADLTGAVIASVQCKWEVERGPQETMERLATLLEETSRSVRGRAPWAIALGLPGPVEFSTTRLVAPAIMPGWDGFSPRAWLRERYDAPVWADNQVHVMALGEWHASPQPRHDLLFIEVGVDVGAGLVIDGRVLRGERGGAGAIGHIRVSDDGTRCRCGKTDCLEVSAGGWSILIKATRRAAESPILSRMLKAAPLTLHDIGVAAQQGDPVVEELLQRAAEDVSAVASNLVTFINPGEVVLGGGVLQAGSGFLRTMDATIRANGPDLVTEQLVVRPSSLTDGYGILGAARLALDAILAPQPLARWLPSRTPLAHSVELQRMVR